jgi:AbiV family abortive infection protein
MRLEDAKTLLVSKQYAGSYYLAGYSIECAIKACIAKQIKLHEFPDRDLVNRAYSHDLEKLIGIAGLATLLQKDMISNKKLELNWAVVKDWNESSRYNIDISVVQAEGFYSACFTRGDGILSWIKKRW